MAKLSIRALSSSAMLLALVSTAQAQDTGAAEETASTGGLSDIVVTATRRATNVQDVPLAITAVGGPQLQAQGITDGVQLARVVPNLFATTGYAGGNPRFAIRGLGSTDFSQGGSSPVAIYVDDVYQPYSFGIGSQLFDLNRVEVLRGPQGTLFGKNTTAGAVAYFSARPTQKFEGYINADYMFGQYDKYTLEGMINAPLSDNLAVRVDGRYERRDNFVRNLAGGERGEYDMFAGRIQFEWQASDDTTINLKLFGMKSNGDATLYHGGFLSNPCAITDPGDPVYNFGLTPYANCTDNNPPPTSEGIDEVNDETNSFEKYYNYGATLRMEHDGGYLNLTSITAYQQVDYEILTNDDGNNTDFFHSRQELDAWQISQELRVATPADKPISAIVGLFGQYDKAFTPSATGSTYFNNGLDYMLRADSNQFTTTLAAFTNVTAKLNDQLSIIGGLRYSYERKKIDLQGIDSFYGGYDFTDENMASFSIYNPPFDLIPTEFAPFDDRYEQVGTKSWRRVTWDATINYKPTDDLMLYAKIAEGFRSGGYNLFATDRASISTVDPEILRSYEVGFKSELFDRRLRLNASAFWYDITNQQVLSTGADGAGIKLSNAGAATVKGFEFELEAAPVEKLRLTASLGYTDARFDSFETTRAGEPVSLAGNRLAYAPEWTSNVSASYDIEVGGGYSVNLNTDWNYRSEVFFDGYNVPYTGDGELLLGNARITLNSPQEGAQWHISAYVNNLTNQTYHTFGFFTGNDWYSRVFGDQRIWGVQAGMKF